MAIIDGTSKDDTLRGTRSADIISGAGGNDILFGLGGADLLIGGPGGDLLNGGPGRDRLNGGRGDDTLLGGGRRDILTGGDGGDLLDGGNSNDMLEGGSGRDRLFGGQGRDTLLGGTRRDFLTGGDGDDRLDGGSGRDMLAGGMGRDVLLGRSGNDTLIGNAEDDRLDGRSGIDTARFSGFKDDYTISIVNGKIEVADQNLADGDDGIDVLSGIEFLQFKDGKLPPPTVISTFELATLNGSNGFTLIGDPHIHSVSSAGDVNGDGLDDLIVGAPFAGSAAGEDFEAASYVVFGKASWVGTPSLGLAMLDGTNGFRLIGFDKYDQSGFSVSSAGDVNGDGFDDVIVGAFGATSAGGENYEGESCVVFGKASWAGTPLLDLATLDGTNGFRVIGIDEGDSSGFAVSSAGDVNGDGFDDVIIGAPHAEGAGGANSEGESYVVFGKASWAGTSSLDLATLDGTNGFRLIGINTSLSGYSVSSADDVNGDGFADLIVGAPFADSAVESEGESYLVFGKASWVGTPALDLAALDGTNGFRLSGRYEYDRSGRSVSSAGDVNGDGFGDLIIGAPRAESLRGYSEGESYVVFGKANWTGTPSLDLGALDGTNGFRMVGVNRYDFSGHEVSSAGDVNGDGFDDLIVGAPGAERAYETEYQGESYVVFGKANWVGTPILDLSMLDGTNGLSLIGIGTFDRSGLSVSSAGDVNGDGFDDLMVGAPAAGESYVVFGGNFSGAVAHLGGLGNDTLAGTADAETFVGGTGNDTLIGSGGADAFQGGAGDDTIQVSTLDFFLVDGGNGNDTLDLDGSGLHLDLTTLADNKTRSIERIDIGGTGNNTLTLSVREVLNLSEEANALLVLGDAGDLVNQGPGWTAATTGGTNGNGTSTIDGDMFQIYHAGAANLLVDTDMTVTA